MTLTPDFVPHWDGLAGARGHAVLLIVVILAALLWPRGRPSPTSGDVGADGGGERLGTRSSTGIDGGIALLRPRSVLAREVRFGRSRPGWVADFAELAAVGLDAGLPSAEAARLACAVGATPGHAEADALATRLSVAEAAGARVGECLAEAAEGDPELAFLAAAWQLTDEYGVAAAPAARTAAEVLRERTAAHDRRTVLSAGPRASMWLLTLLPLSGPLVAILLGLPVSEVYGGGAALVAAGVGLLLTGAGWLWSRALLRRAQRPAEVA